MKRKKIISATKKTKVFAITSPGIFTSDSLQLQKGCTWDILVIDEGHRAKNINTKLRKSLKEFTVSKQKIILTGTPVQNNLDEFFSLFDLV